jgi:uncharacterized ParB-like nuclease family protein
MWDDLQCVSATCNHNEESETAGQKQKYESTGNLEGNGYYFSFDMCKKEKMLNERKRGCGGGRQITERKSSKLPNLALTTYTSYFSCKTSRRIRQHKQLPLAIN